MSRPPSAPTPPEGGEGEAPPAASRPVKRSFSIRGHRTSISLEAAFWEALGELASAEGVSKAVLVARIDAERGSAGLSGAIRVWILARVRAMAGLGKPN